MRRHRFDDLMVIAFRENEQHFVERFDSDMSRRRWDQIQVYSGAEDRENAFVPADAHGANGALFVDPATRHERLDGCEFIQAENAWLRARHGPEPTLTSDPVDGVRTSAGTPVRSNLGYDLVEPFINRGVGVDQCVGFLVIEADTDPYHRGAVGLESDARHLETEDLADHHTVLDRDLAPGGFEEGDLRSDCRRGVAWCGQGHRIHLDQLRPLRLPEMGSGLYARALRCQHRVGFIDDDMELLGSVAGAPR